MNTASNIYRTLRPKESFKEWITAEKNLFAEKIQSGKIHETMDFDEWLNERHRKKQMNAAGDVIKDILNQTAEKLNSTTPAPTVAVKVPKTILGMKPVIFYSLTATVVVVTGALIYSHYYGKK